MPQFSGNLEIDIQTDEITRLRQRVNGFIEQTPAIEEEFSEEFAEDVVESVRGSVRDTFNKSPTGNLESSVSKRRRGSGRYTVQANAYNNGVNYAAWHEYANTGHYAYYEDTDGENTALVNWAKRMGIFENSWRVFVTPHSFMKPGVQKAIKKTRKAMRSGRNPVSKGIAKAFR